MIDARLFERGRRVQPGERPRPEDAYMEGLSHRVGQYILSASGWRAVFAPHQESSEATISTEDKILMMIAANLFAGQAARRCGKKTDELTLLVASDSRPTGESIILSMIPALLSLGTTVCHAYIAAAPEVMAASMLDSEYDGFIYISASHNPVGYNGIKFGYDGRVLSGAESEELITSFRETIRKQEVITSLLSESSRVSGQQITEVLDATLPHKERILEHYRIFTASVASSDLCICSQDQVYNTIRAQSDAVGLGIVCDFNGSARSCSIDRDLIESIGVGFKAIAETPGEFIHRIVPEGRSLDDCCRLLEASFQEDPSFSFGYVPDCDGDRGNIVCMDPGSGRASALAAQEVFALAVLSELAFLYHQGRGAESIAVVVNGPTSMRIDAIAGVFGAKVFRSEVGEASVVALADSLREEGYTVRILGEGSNGGNITHPAAVRDPLNTVLSFLKLLSYTDKNGQKGMFHLWCELSGNEDAYIPGFSLFDVLGTLPVYTTTSAFEDEAAMSIRSTDQERLKQNYEELFAAEFERQRDTFRGMGIHGYREFNTIGTQEIEGMGPASRKAGSTGGLKIVLLDAQGEWSDYLWMRGSKTEPVFRVLVDCRGSSAERHDWLLSFHRRLIEQADQASL